MRLCIALLTILSTTAFADVFELNPRRHAEKIDEDLRMGKLNDRTLEAIEGALTYGTALLRDKGFDADADRIMQEWFYREKAFILMPNKNMGDHDPVQWLFDTWKFFDDTLGRELCMMGHIDDLWIFAMSIKVVVQCQDNVDEVEYARHFVGGEVTSVKLFKGGFAGSLTYWTALVACSGFVGYPWSMLCSPIAQLAEGAMDRWIAPPLSPKVWELACK